MDPKLTIACELFMANSDAIDDVQRLDSREFVMSAAVLPTAHGIRVTARDVKASLDIIKERTAAFSVFRSETRIVLATRMALDNDPEAYLKGVMKTFDQLNKHPLFTSAYELLLAMTAFDQVDDNSEYTVMRIASRTSEIMRLMHDAHPLITGAEDSVRAALMAITPDTPANLCEHMERCYQALLDSRLFGKDSAQSIAQILSLSASPVEEKCNRMAQLATMLADTGHGLGKDHQAAILGAFVDVDAPLATVVDMIGQADDWLKDKKGFGFFGASTASRRMYAAILTLVALDAKMAEADKDQRLTTTTATSPTATVAIEIAIMILLVTLTTATTSSTTSHHAG